MPSLILIGGPPGVGKSTLATRLSDRLPNSVRLDGDDLWRMNPFRVDDRSKAMIMRNIRAILSSFLKERFDYIIFSWVMHEPEIVRDILRGLELTGWTVHHYPLICSEATLLRRIAGDTRERNPDLALERLRQTVNNYPDALDTEQLTSEDLAEVILRTL